jgi:SH3-like domain-containing protein
MSLRVALNRALVFAFGLLPLVCVAATEYRAVAEEPAVMYDAPSVRARQMWVVSPHYPLEVVVALEDWVKVRDVAGDLAWIEKKFLSNKRTVMVTAPSAEVRSEPSAAAPLVFEAQKGVVLEWLEGGAPGWVRVRHADGQTGFVPVGQVWGS